MGRLKGKIQTETETSDQFSEFEKKETGLRDRHGVHTYIEEEKEKEKSSSGGSGVLVRTVWTINLLLGFFLVLWMGHLYSLVLIIAISLQMYREIISLRRKALKDHQVPLSPILNWYFFLIGVVFFYGKLVNQKLPSSVIDSYYLLSLFKYLNLLSFMAWILGFLSFILSLKKGFYLYQFTQFGFSHITLFLIVGQVSSIGINMYEGLIWFIFPCLLVIVNDIFAYIWGKLFGRTKLIHLSPKKTWEGFLGGAITTLFFGIVAAQHLQQYQYLICPQQQIILKPFQNIQCSANPIFTVYHVFPLPSVMHPLVTEVSLTAFQWHSLVLSLFASVIAPFGGFFASGFKRAIKVKDFADIIPGHGGLTDRMDCQILMGMFSYLYLHQVILTAGGEHSLADHVSQMSTHDQIQLYQELQRILLAKHAI